VKDGEDVVSKIEKGNSYERALEFVSFGPRIVSRNILVTVSSVEARRGPWAREAFFSFALFVIFIATV
jgi:hypothetical protein